MKPPSRAPLSQTALNIEDLRRMAGKKLPKPLWDLMDRGNEDDVALRNNAEALRRIKVLPRVLRDVSGRDPVTTLFGREQSLPLVIGPTGPAGLVAFRGEIALARAAAAAGIPFALTSTSTSTLEDVLQQGGGCQWYQPYIWRDHEVTFRGIDRAERAGFEALVLTVDSVVPYNREADIRNRTTMPLRATARNVLHAARRPAWTVETPLRYLRAERRLPRFVNLLPEKRSVEETMALFTKDDSITWDFLRMLRERWPRTLIVKGIAHPDDAVMAADCGADGVVISNHGGIANDASAAPIELLPAVVQAAGDRIAVLVDSGFRRGSDVIKALALGADAVLVGRATLYGLAAAGEPGARRALEILSMEIRRMMGVIGVSQIDEIGPEHVLVPAGLHQPAAIGGTGLAG